jgi:hypothetical protein
VLILGLRLADAQRGVNRADRRRQAAETGPRVKTR